MNKKTIERRIEEVKKILTPMNFTDLLDNCEFKMDGKSTFRIVFPTYKKCHVSYWMIRDLHNAGYHIVTIENRDEHAGFPNHKMQFVLDIYLRKYMKKKSKSILFNKADAEDRWN